MPPTVKLRRLVRGLPIAVRVPKPRSRVLAELRAAGLRASRTTLIARKVIRRAGAGRLRLVLKPGRKAARALRAARRKAVRATLRVRVEPPRGRAVTYTRRITVKR